MDANFSSIKALFQHAIDNTQFIADSLIEHFNKTAAEIKANDAKLMLNTEISNLDNSITLATTVVDYFQTLEVILSQNGLLPLLKENLPSNSLSIRENSKKLNEEAGKRINTIKTMIKARNQIYSDEQKDKAKVKITNANIDIFIQNIMFEKFKADFLLCSLKLQKYN
ncbi:MAG: hypothetical protein LEGION0398_MBIBDBAK_00463 [Legionellaceae bacterium]